MGDGTTTYQWDMAHQHTNGRWHSVLPAGMLPSPATHCVELPSQALPFPEAAVVKVYSSWPTSVQVDLSAVLSTQSTSAAVAIE